MSLHNLSIVLTDVNATVSSSVHGPNIVPDAIGMVFSDPVTNSSGECLLLLHCCAGYCLLDTYFPCNCIHQWAWYNPDVYIMKAITHILVLQHSHSCIFSCRVYRGTELANTDHWLLVASSRTMLWINQSEQSRLQPDICLMLDISRWLGLTWRKDRDKTQKVLVVTFLYSL